MAGSDYWYCPVCDTKALYDESDESPAVVVLHEECWAKFVGAEKVLASREEWHAYCPDGDDEPALHHACPGAPDDEGKDVGRPVDFTLAALLDVAAVHVCEPMNGGSDV